MSRNAKLWLISGASLVIFMIIAWFVGSALGASAGEEWLVRVLLWILGLLATGLIVWVLAKSGAGSGDGLSAAEDELETTFATSKNRLKHTGTTLATVPVVLVLGPEGSTKTTVVIHSGLEPDLLAGEVFRGQTVGPTTGANVWFSRKAVIVEAGGKLLGDPARWSRMIRHIQPQRLAAVLRGREQAPRVAVVCFSCEEFLKPGAGEAVPQAAQGLRDKLAEVSRRLGVRLPVYVLFTKADRIPYFAEYVRSFSETEVREVLGSTLRLVPAAAEGSYADREYQRLNDAFERLVWSLARKRLDLLPREVDLLVQAGTYEFPREFRKIVPLATQFLVELCKPSQLAVSPFLRGFYFSGVRAVIAGDAPAQPIPAAGAGQMGATSVFDPQRPPAAAAQAVVTPTSRKVPQWLFINRLFGDVILRDRVALGVPQIGAGLNMLRRGLLSFALGLSFLFILGFIVSFASNRSLERRVQNAALGLLGAVTAEPELPTHETLRRLESMREQVARLQRYEREGPPLRLRWWLYTGARLYPSAWSLYARKLDSLMLDTVRDQLSFSLAGLPEGPTETTEFQPTYETLKAYLMITGNPEHLEADFLASILPERWVNNRDIDGERRELAGRQFRFYGGELCRDNSCARAPDAGAVARARRFLRQFTGAEQIYQLILDDAARTHPSIQFNRTVQGSAPYVSNTYEVHGAFTRDGWDFVQGALRDIRRYLTAEDWVMGEQASREIGPDSLQRAIRRIYYSDYAQQWMTYLTSSAIVPFQSLDDAATRLARLSSNQSPLLALIQLASNHTTVDSLLIGAAFQPAHQVVPPDTAALVVEGNTAYMTALLELTASLEQVVAARGDNRFILADEARGAASDAKVAAQQLAQGFNIEGLAGQVGNALEKILQDPITLAERRLPRRPRVVAGAGVISAVREFCREFNLKMTKFPFNPAASEAATLAEMTDMFHPETGDVARLIQNDLSDIVEVRASGVAAKSGATPSPRRELIDFLNRARNVGQTFWHEGAEPNLRFTARLLTTDIVPNLSLSVDGQNSRYSRTSTAQGLFSWIGASARQVRLTGRVAGRDETLLSFDGQWALFNLFYLASGWQPSRGRQRVVWQIPWQAATVRVEAEVRFATDGDPILNRDFFPGTVCPRRAF